jgi:hypothetical protein
VNREGTLHIVVMNPGKRVPRYSVGFADYSSASGAMKTVAVDGEQGLRDFFTRTGINQRIAMSVFENLRTEGEASVLRVILSDDMLLDLGLKESGRSGKERVEAAIRALKKQGHVVQAVVRHDGTMWFEIDRGILTSWQEMLNLADGVYSFDGLIAMYRRRQELEKQTFSVRFTVFRETAGPVLAYSLSAPFVSASFSSRGGAHYPDMEKLIGALNAIGLPGKRVVGEVGTVYTVTGAQLSQLGLQLPEASAPGT